MRPTLQELENISALLLSSDDAGRLLGKELLLQHPNYIPAMRRELMLAAFLAEEWEGAQEFQTLLQRHFSPKIIEQQAQGFLLFKEAPRYAFYPRHSMQLYRMLRDHENLRIDYEPLMLKNSFYVLRYLAVIECIREKLPKEKNTALYYCSLILKVLPAHEATLKEMEKLQ